MIFILDRHEKVQAILTNNGSPGSCPYYDDVMKEDLSTGVATYEFRVPTNHPNADLIEEGGYVVRADLDGNLRMFTIIQVEETHAEQSEKYVYAEDAGLELLNDIIRPNTYTSINNDQALDIVLQDTRWKRGRTDYLGVQNVVFEDYQTVVSALQMIADLYGGELSFRVKLENGEVVGRYVDLVKQRGTVTKKRFVFNKDIMSIKRTVDMSELATALIGIGKGDAYGNYTTFRNVSYSKSNGDPFDKPLNQDWVGDPDALQRYGVQGKHLFGVFQYETENPEDLLKATWNELQKRKNPKITYELDVALLERLAGIEHEKVRIGDTVYIIDETLSPALYLEARIIALETCFSDPSKDKCTLGNFKPAVSNITAQMRALQSQLLRKAPTWDEAKAKADALSGTVDNISAELEVQAGQIALKANKTDVYTKQEVNNQLANKADNSTVSAIEQRVTQAEAQLSVQADQIATKVSRTEFESLQVGGRNLFFNSADFAGWQFYNAQDAAVSTDIPLKNINAKSITWKVGTNSNAGGYYQRFRNDDGNTKFTNGQVYTVSAWAKASTDATLYIEAEGVSGARKDFNLTTNWQKIQLTFTGNGSAHTIVFNGIYSSKSVTFYLALPKLEEGNRATDWTPAPEDVQDQIDGLGTRVTNAETSITQLSDQIVLKASKSEVYTKQEVDSKLANGDIYVRGTGLNRNANRIVRVNGQNVYDGEGRGHLLTVLRRSDLSVVSNTVYDTHNDAQSTNLANALNALSDDVIVILSSYDSAYINQTLADALVRCGGSGTLIRKMRVPNVFIGIPKYPKGSAIEVVTDDKADSPYAEVFTKVVNGVPQGMNTALTTIESRLTTAETAITQNANEIALKANKTDVYTKQEVNNQLANKADNSTVSAIEQRVTQAEAQLKVQADQIATLADEVNRLKQEIETLKRG